ncbi:MAG: YbaK/EbsC family protein [Actinomycetota bacterium]|nr:YbaK/EbsC family protein [Actinomycetota bacterium]MED5293401.1 YbaK/EbsC family protein [Actinomycetota bacterium]MEE3256983.1 YbaK/EbsC family protein [Actinomycetota bacterium]
MTDPVIEILEELAADYQLIECAPELADTTQFCEKYGYQLDESANAILVVGKAEPRLYALCVVLATTQVDVNKIVRKKLEVKKASFASPEETEAITGMTLGGVTPFGLPKSLPIWIDSRVLNCPKVIVGGGSRDRKIYVTPQTLAELPSSEVIENLAKERPPNP